MSKGSTWNIWDFHVHSPFSVLNNGFGDNTQETTWLNYFKKLDEVAKRKPIAALGITDYLSIDGYKRVKAHYENKKEEAQQNNLDDYFLKGIFIFPNVEFRILPSTAQDRPINLHLLFSPTIADELEDKLFSQLTFSYNDATFNCSKNDLIRLGKKHANADTMPDNTAYETGVNQFKITIDNLKAVLKANSHIRRNTLVIVSNSNHDGASGIQHSSLVATRDNIYYFADGIFSANPNDRDYFLGNKVDSPSEIMRRYRSLKPCIHGSDSHELDKIGVPDKNRYCWLKSEVSWEGLKYILYEPDERVKIQEGSPEPNKSIYTLSKIGLNATQVNGFLSVDSLNTALNQNLITIIGGRGSGKTALLDLLASCFHEGEKLPRMKNSFFHRLYVGDGSRKREIIQPIFTTIEFRSGENFSKNVGVDTVCFEKANIKYLTQNHFDEYTENPDKLHTHIIDLVFGEFPDDRVKFDCIELKINEHEQAIQAVNLELQQLRLDISGKKNTRESDLKIKEGEKSDYLQRINEIEQKQGKSDDDIRKLTERLDSLKNRKRALESLIYRLSEFSKELGIFKTQYEQNVKEINTGFSSFQDILVTLLPIELSDLKGVLDVINRNNDEIAKSITLTDSSIIVAEKEINELKGIGKVIADLRQKVSDTNVEILSINTRIHEIVEKENRILSLEQERISTYIEIIKMVMEQKTFLQEMIIKFESDKNDLLNRLKFSAIVDIRYGKEVLENLAEKINKVSHSENELRATLLPIFEKVGNLMNGDDQNADFLSSVREITTFAKDLKLKRATTESDLFNTVLKRFFSIGLKIEFSGKALSDLSMGERAVVLLKILLALDDKPLFIDQPEEHLDNRYIYDELIPAFRSAKTRRQIIIATHNANLVVNTDAEQIIIAEPTNGKLFYKIGSLENMDIRESIKRILEGGDEAFKRREEKYGLKF